MVKSKLLVKVSSILAIIFFIEFVASLFFYFGVQAQIRAAVVADQRELASRIFHDIDREMLSYYSNIELFASDAGVVNALGSQNINALEEELSAYFYHTGPWNGLGVYSVSGQKIVSAGSEMNVSRLMVQQTVNQGVYYSDVTSADSGKTVYFAATIYREGASNPLGVFVGSLPWTVIEEKLIEYDTDSIILNDRNGNILTSIGVSEADALIVGAQEPGVAEFLGNEWNLEIHQDHNDLFDPVARTFVIFFTVFASVFGIGFVLFYLFLQRSVISPVLELSLVSKAVAQKDFSQKVSIDSDDEINDLVQNFNSMVEKLASQYEIMNEEIRKRTKEMKSSQKNLEKTVQKRTGELEKTKQELERRVSERTTELEEHVEKLKQMNKFMIDRETKMVELKEEIEALKQKYEKK